MSQEGMRFSEHVGELRSRLKKVFTAYLVVLVILVFLPADPIQQAQHLDQYLSLQFLNYTVIAAFLHTVRAYILPTGWSLIAANGIGEGMEVYFVSALVLALALCMPAVAYETYKFIDPALKDEERQLLYPFVVSTSLLFLVGVLFGYFVISKFLILALAPFFLATGTQFFLDSSAFYYIVLLIIGSTGASFTAPVFVFALIRLRVLEADFFSHNRVVIWFIIWIVTGLFLTPDGGPLLDLVIFIPIVALVEAAVFLGRRGVKGAPPARTLDRCRYCAAKVPKGRLFCPNCGKGVS